MNPETTYPSREELIDDAVFVEAENNGYLRPDRLETLLSAILFSIQKIAAFQGVPLDDLYLSVAGNVNSTRPQNPNGLPEDEQKVLNEMKRKEKERQERQRIRNMFAKFEQQTNGLIPKNEPVLLQRLSSNVPVTGQQQK